MSDLCSCGHVRKSHEMLECYERGRCLRCNVCATFEKTGERVPSKPAGMDWAYRDRYNRKTNQHMLRYYESGECAAKVRYELRKYTDPEKPMLYISHIFVELEYRKRGVATRLVEELRKRYPMRTIEWSGSISPEDELLVRSDERRHPGTVTTTPP